MKLVVISTIACALTFVGAGVIPADEIADLKARVEVLEEQQLELAAEQDESASLFDGTTVGGHLKFYLLDQSYGKVDGDKQHNTVSAGASHLYLYAANELTDFLSAELQLDFRISAGATPRLGRDITRATSGSVSTNIHQAFVTVLPGEEVEIRAGIFNPLFSEEYGTEVWWDDIYHQSDGLSYVESWHDAGVEVYRNFELGDSVSLPVYLYGLNGNHTLVDNNSGKTVLLHVGPEFLEGRLRVFGSLGWGYWDDKDKYGELAYAIGAEVSEGLFTLRSEYMVRDYDDLPIENSDGDIIAREDGSRKGVYVLAKYALTEYWEPLIKYAHTELYNTSSTTMRTDTYDSVIMACNFWIMDSSVIMPSISYTDGETSDDGGTLKYWRYNLGWRTTF